MFITVFIIILIRLHSKKLKNYMSWEKVKYDAEKKTEKKFEKKSLSKRKINELRIWNRNLISQLFLKNCLIV